MLKNVTLTGEQKQILQISFGTPIQIKGVAGSGKTTVAIYRAKNFLETQGFFGGDVKVGIFTFNKNLVKYLQSLSSNVETVDLDDNSKPGLNADITNFHKWAYHFIKRYGERLNVINENRQKNILEDILYEFRSPDSPNILNKRPQFFVDEISWMKGKLIDDFETYASVQRTGRGTQDRVTANDRKYLWEIYKRYDNHLKERNLHDFDDFALVALKIMNSNANYPLYDHLVVDEAQDLTKAEMVLLTKLVPQDRKCITVIADAAQKIYKKGFTWKEVGLSVAGGRTHELTRNYRNNIHIALAAKSLLDHEEDQSEFTKPKSALKSDSKPELIYCDSHNDELEKIGNKIKEIRKSNFPGDTIVVLHRSSTGLRKIEHYFSTNNIKYKSFKTVSDYNFSTPEVITCTMSSIKGLEFDHVLITDLNKQVIPDPLRYSDDVDELHESTERRLLYMAMTRAQNQLYMFCVEDRKSKFIDELNHDHFKIIGNSKSSGVDYSFDDDLPF